MSVKQEHWSPEFKRKVESDLLKQRLERVTDYIPHLSLKNLPTIIEVGSLSLGVGYGVKTLLERNQTLKELSSPLPPAIVSEASISLEQEHPGWVEALSNGIGPEWHDYTDCKTTTVPDTCQLRLVTDGKLDLEPKELKAKDEVLATAVISLDEYYLDKNSKLQKVSVPQIIRLPDGRLVKIGMDFIDEGIIERAKKLPIKADGGQKGLVVYPLMSSNAAEFAQVAPFLSDGDRKVAELVTKYNEANQENMKRFLEDGDPSIKVILPVLNCLAADEIVNLPGN